MTPTEPKESGARRASLGRALRRARARLLEPIDARFLAAFRLLYGLVLTVSMLRFLAYGWVDSFFVEPAFHFKYWGFSWVDPLPGPLMHALFVLLAGAALAMALGLVYRASALVFSLGLAYVQLIDVTTYLNHYYLAALLGFLLAASPAARVWSVDAWWRARRSRARGVPNTTVEAPTIARAWAWLFRFQVGVVYVFAGLAKAQSDWLFHAQPLSIWLGAVTELPLIGRWLTLPFVPFLLSWCGFLFDSSIVLFLLWRRSRPFAYGVVIAFHALTSVFFPIGMFPLIMVLSALVFFPPSWPADALRLLRGWLARSKPGERAPDTTARRMVVVTSATLPPRSAARERFATLGLGLALLYCAVQLALPLRYLAYGGNVLWDEQGMRFSWRVMLRAKGGDTTFVVRKQGEKHAFFVSPRRYLTVLQESEMSSQPDLILQLAHRIHADYAPRLGPIEVHAESRVALNGRRSVPFIDPSIDLARVSDGFSLSHLVLPAPTATPPHTHPVL